MQNKINIKHIINKYNIDNLNTLYIYLYITYNIYPYQYYLINLDNNKIIRNNKQFIYSYNSNNYNNILLQPRLNGGGIFNKIFNKIISFIFKIFSPLLSPLRGIGSALLMIIKAFIYIGMLALWFFKFMVWFITDFLFSIPLDIFTLIKRITYILFDTITSSLYLIIKNISNNVGNMTISAALTGADNVQDNNNKNDKYFSNYNYKQKCYRTSDGTIPFSVIISTILCPPIGVFMEYGLTGWLNILICAILTLIFYFPGLIYALILLYC